MSFNYSLSDVDFNEAAMFRLLNDPSGTTGGYMRRMGIKIIALAVRMTGVKTGRLAKSIKMSQRSLGTTGQELRVYSNLSYAYVVHEGSHPHVIDPPGNRVMVFNSRGQRVYARRVHHPGTRGKRYLSIPLRQVVR